MRNKYLLLKSIPFLFSLNSFAQSQLPNSGFETWTTVNGSPTAPGWDNSNICNPGPPQTCFITVDKTTEARTGTYAAKITTISSFGQTFPGVLVSGGEETEAGSPITIRPTKVEGYYKFNKAGTDVGSITVFIGDSAADEPAVMEQILISETKTAYTKFEIPITYEDNSKVNSIVVVFSTSIFDQSTPTSGTAGTYMIVDDINLIGTPTATVESNTVEASVFPNPASDLLTIQTNEKLEAVKILNLQGAAVKEQFSEINTIDISDLQVGTYVVEITTAKGITRKKINKN